MEKSKDTWTVLSSEYLHRAPWLTVRKDHVVLPNGNHIPSYYILEYPNWVNTIAITRDGQFVFIRQYRHGIQNSFAFVKNFFQVFLSQHTTFQRQTLLPVTIRLMLTSTILLMTLKKAVHSFLTAHGIQKSFPSVSRVR